MTLGIPIPLLSHKPKQIDARLCSERWERESPLLGERVWVREYKTLASRFSLRAKWPQILQFLIALTSQPLNNTLGNGVCLPSWENCLTVSVLMTPTNKKASW